MVRSESGLIPQGVLGSPRERAGRSSISGSLDSVRVAVPRASASPTVVRTAVQAAPQAVASKAASSSGLLPQVIGGVRKAKKREARSEEKAPSFKADQAMVTGLGGIGFRALSPPGSGRLVRIPFYPLNPFQSWTGVNGIDTAGDDPILQLTIPAGSTRSNKLTMLTYQFDYGAYKLLGLQTNFQGSYDVGMQVGQGGPPPAPGTAPLGVAISLGNLSLYNGQTLFVQLEDMDASTFQVLPDYQTSFITTATSIGSQRENPYNYLARRSRFFPGMRDYPVVFGTAHVTVQVSAFIGRASLTEMIIPFSCFIVADLVEDYVFGDPLINSASSRAGANVKLGAKDLGMSRAGVHQYDLSSARYKRKS